MGLSFLRSQAADESMAHEEPVPAPKMHFIEAHQMPFLKQGLAPSV